VAVNDLKDRRVAEAVALPVFLRLKQSRVSDLSQECGCQRDVPVHLPKPDLVYQVLREFRACEFVQPRGENRLVRVVIEVWRKFASEGHSRNDLP
jgi:hypothetical protein